ncbi:ABC transporter permease subunit [Paenibacillus sp. PL2-23]|uniref:ABC transporter permease n=1 Tax=Paenibacillus sp. PL2-23 TaxID=2100729 RepID=UPI0030FCDA66
MLWKRVWSYRALYLMLLPGLLWFLIYKYIPMSGAIIAFKDYSIGKGIFQSDWADPWYKYFQDFYESPYFYKILTNTLLISFYKLIFGLFPPILFAIMLNEAASKWLQRLVQTISYMPHFFSWVIIYGMLLMFLSEGSGIVNKWLVDGGGEAYPFLTSTESFRSILILSDIWQSLGWSAIIYLAAMSSIDPTLYEAARVDGAGRLRMIWHITLPGIRNVITLMLILNLGRIMDAGFEQIYVMYNIQVYDVADIIDTWVFRTGLEQLSYSLATAVGLFKSIIGLILVLGSNQLAKRWGGSIW